MGSLLEEVCTQLRPPSSVARIAPSSPIDSPFCASANHTPEYNGIVAAACPPGSAVQASPPLALLYQRSRAPNAASKTPPERRRVVGAFVSPGTWIARQLTPPSSVR